MRYETITDFEQEIESITRILEEKTGQRVEGKKRHTEPVGIGCDFVLPYSTLPDLSGNQWNKE